jgi:hypothetical protein
MSISKDLMLVILSLDAYNKAITRVSLMKSKAIPMA